MGLQTMTGLEGGSVLARSVRDLASDAKRVISGPADRAEAEAILRRIDGLRGAWSEAPAAPIHAWLASLRREVERV